MAGWQAHELRDTLNISLTPLSDDPLPRFPPLALWEPWPTKLAASVFLYKLRELTCPSWSPDQPACLDAALARCRDLETLSAAFSRLPENKQRKYVAPKGSLFTDTWVSAGAGNGMENAEGVIVGGERDEDGQWMLDGDFTIFTPNEQLIVCHGWNCHVVVE